MLRSGHQSTHVHRLRLILVNYSDLLRRWTSDRFLATPHRVVDHSGKACYAIPFFFDCGADVVMECLLTGRAADRPSRYEPIASVADMAWYRQLYFGQAKDSPRLVWLRIEAQAPGLPLTAGYMFSTAARSGPFGGECRDSATPQDGRNRVDDPKTAPRGGNPSNRRRTVC